MPAILSCCALNCNSYYFYCYILGDNLSTQNSSNKPTEFGCYEYALACFHHVFLKRLILSPDFYLDDKSPKLEPSFTINIRLNNP